MSVITRAVALLLVTSACAGGARPLQPDLGDLDKTGLEGNVYRGPIQPVCHEGEPCDGPVHARFTLQRANHVVARFMSDSAGHFRVYASPGSYAVVPYEPIGIGQQEIQVLVGAEGLTHVDLMF